MTGDAYEDAYEVEENAPSFFVRELAHVLRPPAHIHKYTRGSAFVVGGALHMSGAARLAARACLRTGAGVVTVGVHPKDVMTYASHLTSIMIAKCMTPRDILDVLEKKQVKAVLIGPGCGVCEATRAKVLTLLETDIPLVLDADALTVFQRDPPTLFSQVHARYARCTAPVVFTPHEGELRCLFGEADSRQSRKWRACVAARTSGAVIIYKGCPTYIALPITSVNPVQEREEKLQDSFCVYAHHHQSSYLATAGSGDVLAGIVTALLAQGVDAITASLAGVWIHGDIGVTSGPGLISEDMPDKIPHVLRKLLEAYDGSIHEKRSPRCDASGAK